MLSLRETASVVILTFLMCKMLSKIVDTVIFFLSLHFILILWPFFFLLLSICAIFFYVTKKHIYIYKDKHEDGIRSKMCTVENQVKQEYRLCVPLSRFAKHIAANFSVRFNCIFLCELVRVICMVRPISCSIYLGNLRTSYCFVGHRCIWPLARFNKRKCLLNFQVQEWRNELNLRSVFSPFDYGKKETVI